MLRSWAQRIADWKDLRSVYVYFDNDQAGYAAQNAIELKRMVSGAPGHAKSPQAAA